ncbi:MAG TPA: hypothetical protein VFK02_29495 [Kofleriaceae bacterium]|nr:hypothetical protein [Kofleriaceae bacterium]
MPGDRRRSGAAREARRRCRAAALVFAVALGAAGCFSDRGVAIEVDVGDTGATSVELYLGRFHCDPDRNPAGIDCTHISPPDGTIALDGDIWFRDDLLPETAKVTGGKATFRVESSSETTLPIVIAVGLVDDNATPHAVAAATLRDLTIPAGGARVVTMALIATRAVKPGQTETTDLDEDRAMVWAKRVPPSSCVVVEHWRPGQDVRRDFIVPVGDPDCDDVVPECNAAAYHGSSEAGDPSGTPDCFVQGSACTLGSHGCSDDGGARQGTCVALPVCVPGDFCMCTSLDAECMRGLIDDGALNMIPRIVCDVPALLGTDLCTGNDGAKIDLSERFAGTHCGHDPLISNLTLSGFATTGDFGGAVMELSTAAEPCSFDVKWKSGMRTATADTDDRGVVQLGTDGATLLLPIVFRFHPVTIDLCPATPFQCALQGDPADSLWSCVR